MRRIAREHVRALASSVRTRGTRRARPGTTPRNAPKSTRDTARGLRPRAVRIRHGKGRKERIVPIGSRALAWIHRYMADARPQLVTSQDDGTLFLTFTGKAFWPDTLTQLARDYVKRAGITKSGSCHLFRHTMATLMLDNGADTRFIQEMLGHANLQTTQIYTHVAIKKLKEIHTATHPGATLEKLPSLAAEDEKEPGRPILSE